ncbi:SH2D5 protein, partial [Stercorarius parasiticus]|nr:SH2D5 protein [Stercorarius parasiticus]
QYVGSFVVEDLDLQQQAGRLEEQLRALKVGHLLLGNGEGPQIMGGYPRVGQSGPPQRRIPPGQDCPRRRSVVRAPNLPTPPQKIPLLLLFLIFAGSFFCLPQVQTLHLLLCRSFQLGYLLAHPEEQA